METTVQTKEKKVFIFGSFVEPCYSIDNKKGLFVCIVNKTGLIFIEWSNESDAIYRQSSVKTNNIQ